MVKAPITFASCIMTNLHIIKVLNELAIFLFTVQRT